MPYSSSAAAPASWSVRVVCLAARRSSAGVVGGDDAVPRQLDQLGHLGATCKNGQLLGRVASGRADSVQHSRAGHTARQQGHHIRGHPLGAEGHGRFTQRFFQRAVRGTCFLS
mgnify:CR=1 FL=1